MNEYDYDDNRPPRRLLIGAAALVALVLLAAAFVIGRASAPAAGPTSSAAPATTQAGPGPTRTVNGVPVGYAHTQDGAVAAATNFLMVVDGPLITQPDKYRSAIDTLSAPEAREKQRSDAETTLSGSQYLITYAEKGRTVVSRVAPLAYHVDRYTGSAAQLSIWAEALIAVDGVISLRELWATTTLTVRWTDGDWRLASIGAPTSSSYGPAPTITQPSVVAAALPPQLVNYRSYQPNVGT
ncbi:MAG TPA: hypothetical protein VOB72_20835 [Candidatus Dormibacteraeota bacterium]|nr:hypothetical protein [Candidatus Dormibacteraeota bacterium]